MEERERTLPALAPCADYDPATVRRVAFLHHSVAYAAANE